MEETKSNLNQTLLTWTTPEFIYQEKRSSWFIALFLIAGAFVIVGILMENYVFSFLVFLATLLIFLETKKQPRILKIEVSSQSIKINDNPYPYAEIKSFHIFEKEDLKSLSLINKSRFKPMPLLPLNDQDPKKIREILSQFLPEKEHEEFLIDVIARKLKF